MFTIEPILLEGAPELAMFEDNWTCTTIDGLRAAQQEHTLLITETVRALAGSPAQPPRPVCPACPLVPVPVHYISNLTSDAPCCAPLQGTEVLTGPTILPDEVAAARERLSA